MILADTDRIIRDYLVASSTKTDPLIALVGARIYCPRLPEKIELVDGAGDSTPAISFFSRGGLSTPYIPGVVTPSVQFDCWATDTGITSGSIKARQIYRALYNALQGIQNVNAGSIIIAGTDGNDYRCILVHTSATADKPITGANWATYWVATGGSGVGDTWSINEAYKTTYQIMSAIEEVQGQDLVDEILQDYFRVLTFFSIMIRAE